MNATRRKKIEEALEILQWAAEEERAAYDNLPESLQDSEKGQRMEEAADALEEAASLIEEFVS